MFEFTVEIHDETDGDTVLAVTRLLEAVGWTEMIEPVWSNRPDRTAVAGL